MNNACARIGLAIATVLLCALASGQTSPPVASPEVTNATPHRFTAGFRAPADEAAPRPDRNSQQVTP